MAGGRKRQPIGVWQTNGVLSLVLHITMRIHCGDDQQPRRPFMAFFRHSAGAALALLFGLVFGLPASAQNNPAAWFGRLFQQPSATAPVPAAREGGPQWSGQSGASGDPRMSAEAIRAAAADFPNCIAALAPQAERRGISLAAYQRFTAGLAPDLSIMDKLDAQPEFVKAPWDYLDLLVSEDRIARLYRPSPRVFPWRVFGGARDPAARRYCAGSFGRLMGGGVRADPVHADGGLAPRG